MTDSRTDDTDRLRPAWISSVRVRLLVIAILPMLVVLPLLLGATIARWSSKFDELLIAKVNGELTIAHQYLDSILETSGERVQALGNSVAFERTIGGGNTEAITKFLDRQRNELGLDFLYLLQKSGAAGGYPDFHDEGHFSDWPVVASALSGRPLTAIDLFPEADLERLSPDLAAKARIDLLPTLAAVPTERTVETRGMVVHTSTPVMLGGKPAALVGGILLNRNLDFIDTINNLVYPAASLTAGSIGTATLFLDDVRISTNVRLFENVRALGTRVSAIVRNTVLGQGEVWLDRAFVVNDWYISAYEPVVDSFGKRIGMLYVGFLDTPYRTAKAQTLYSIIGAMLLVVILSVPIFLRWAGSIFRPLEKMLGTISKVEKGDLSARTGLPPSEDEIGRVASHLDHLLRQIQERDSKLRRQTDELNDRVKERTSELFEANKRLEATTKQLVVSEKLAAIGEITAGIAHEINNPMAVIQGNFDVIREETRQEAEKIKTELNLIDEQIHSVTVLVSKLLQFARPDEFSGSLENQAPKQALDDCMVLVQHLLQKGRIKVIRHDAATGTILINRTELQQVLINLIVNAIHAMPQGGTLTLRTYNSSDDGSDGVVIEVSDTGKGIPRELVSKIFDPFFTTKEREGTGLGLSITKTIINRYGGKISVDSREGQGASFAIWMPVREQI